MDEEEMIRRIRNSLRAGMEEAGIIRKLQGEGYRLEYIEALIKKARGRRLFFSFLIVSFLLFVTFILLVGVVSYTLFLRPPSVLNKENLTNPLDGMRINFDKKQVSLNDSSNSVAESNLALGGGSAGDVNNVEGDDNGVYLEEIEITPDFISYLLNEIGAWQLHPNPLSGDVPLINFEIEGKDFNSVVVNNKIKTHEGLVEGPDLTFVSNKEDIIHAMLSSDPDYVFRESYDDGRSSVRIEASETELFTKGYVPLYNSLKG